MSLEKAEKYLEEKGFLDHVIELEASTSYLQHSHLGKLFSRQSAPHPTSSFGYVSYPDSGLAPLRR